MTFAITLRDALELEHVPAAGQAGTELHPLGIALPFDQLDLIQLLDARLHLLGFVGLIAEAVDKTLHAPLPCSADSPPPQSGASRAFRSSWNFV